MPPQVVVANRLRDGIVVFLGTGGEWVERVEECAPAADAEGGARLLAAGEQAAAEQLVVGPELIDVEECGGALTPVKMREAIRARGPTVRTDLGKQAEQPGS